MSGPTTVVITAEPVTALLAAAALRATEAIAAGYAEAADLRAAHAATRQADRTAQAAASRQGQAALEQEAQAAEAQLEQLRNLAAAAGHADAMPGSLPARPQDPVALAAYIRGLRALGEEVRAVLLTEAARRQADMAEAPREIALPATLAMAAESVAQRLLARIAHLGPPPADIAALARELDATLPGERAELLASELRRRIQAHLAALQERMVREATATIVEQSLKDLGYQVEEVAHTLFVDGGIVHFRRPGWGDHMVRMRIDAKAATANFNVVRAIDAGSNERSVLDHIAEDRWCAEFPALLQALAARGIRLDVTRRLAAGELPVQLVARDKLPRFADEEALRPVPQALAKEIK